MKIAIAALFIALATVPSRAQTLATVSGTAQDPVALAQAAVASIPSGNWAGKVDLTPDVALGTWQSLKSTDQAFGISKRFLHLDKGGNTLVNVGLFAGIEKPIFTAPGAAPCFLGGDIISIPGSTLDWALGTKWGDAWAPRLKTGVLFAHDLSRLNKTHLFGDFIGIGATYLIGSN